MTGKRYPSKNCIRLTAEVEQLSGDLAEFACEGRVVRLTLGDREWAVASSPENAVALDADKRLLLVTAKREFLTGERAFRDEMERRGLDDNCT